MKSPRTRQARPETKKTSRFPAGTNARTAFDHALILADTICVVAGSDKLLERSNAKVTSRLSSAIVEHDTAFLYGWLVEACSYQGVSDAVAAAYMDQHGRLQWQDVERAFAKPVGCAK